MKTQQHTYVLSNENNILVRLHHKVKPPPHFLYRDLQFSFSLALDCKVLQIVRCYTIPCFTYSRPHIFFLTQRLVTNIFLHNIPNVLDWIHVDKFPGHARRGVPLHSRNVLLLLELWRGARSCIKYIISLRTQHIQMSLYFAVITIDAIVVFGADRMRNITLSAFRLL